MHKERLATPARRSSDRFVCPVDRGALRDDPAGLVCADCATLFPIVRDVPVLINDRSSVFRIADYQGPQAYQGASGYGGSADRTGAFRRAYRSFARKLSEVEIPGVTYDPVPAITSVIPDPEILVIGSGERSVAGRVTYSDVAFAANVDCIADAHDLPFRDGSFDVVRAEAVLEHVCDPQRCVSEIIRVLRPGGFVWAVTPFLQPVHMGAYDFTRFTHLGHRRLFRDFDGVADGMVGGPAYSSIHLLRSLLTALTDRPTLKAMLRLAGLLITYPVRYTDPLLSRTKGAYNAGCAFYFLGTKRESPVSDRDIIAMFRG